MHELVQFPVKHFSKKSSKILFFLLKQREGWGEERRIKKKNPGFLELVAQDNVQAVLSISKDGDHNFAAVPVFSHPHRKSVL